MRIAQVLGKVTLNRQLPAMVAGSLRLAAPLSLDELAERSTSSGRADSSADAGAPGAPQADTLVVWDDLGAGEGSLIAVSEGAEAAQPFRPALKPIDAYCAAILDNVHLP